MSAQKFRYRPKSSVSFNNFALVDKAVGPIALRDHLTQFVGCKLDPDEFIWGVYGAQSYNRMMFLADSLAARQKKNMLIIKGIYQFDGEEPISARTDREMTVRNGFLHIERITSEFREELFEQLLLAGKEMYPGFSAAAADEKNLTELILDYPGLIKSIFDIDPRFLMVVVPVHQIYDQTDRRKISMAVMRKDAKRVISLGIKYREEIEVLI